MVELKLLTVLVILGLLTIVSLVDTVETIDHWQNIGTKVCHQLFLDVTNFAGRATTFTVEI